MNKPSFVTVPNKSLHATTKKVVNFDTTLGSQIKTMTEALRYEGGVGLAANQLGFDNRVVIAECPYKDRGIIPLTVFINPVISDYSPETDLLDEGCLSIPPIELETERSKKIKVKYHDEAGHIHKITPKGFLARILQHEIDHLNGILFTDRVKTKYLKDFPEIKTQKVIFIGSGEFASIILKGLLMMGVNVVQIITEKAKPAGRKKIAQPTQVHELAKLFKQDLIETENIRQNITKIKQIKPDLIILSDFGQILPNEVLEIPRLGAINLHPSLLPKYRGATPIQTAILNGDEETGVSLIKMAPKIDQGPILAQIKTEIFPHENTLELEKRLAVLAVKLLFIGLPRIFKGRFNSLVQDEAEVSKTRKFSKQDGEIDWRKSTSEIERQIRALFPWPGSYTFTGQKRLIIHQAHLDEGELILDIVQLEGKMPVTFTDFLKGYRGPKPDWFSKIKI